MSTEKMLEEFEAWASTPVFGLRAGHFVKGDDGEYLNYPTQCYFQVWQASRESLVIELKAPHNDYDNYRDNEVNGACKYYDQAKKAIHAAGVKTK